MRSWLDEAELVHVAAAATGLDAADLLGGADVAALARVAADLETATSPLDAAATALLGVLRHRPFAGASPATAWLAAAHLLGVEGRRLRIGPIGAASLIAALPDLSHPVVVEVLLQQSDPPQSWLGRLLGAFGEVRRADAPSVRPCPACGRPVVRHRLDLGREGPWTSAADAEVVARCAVAHREHDRWAHVRPLVPA